MLLRLAFRFISQPVVAITAAATGAAFVPYSGAFAAEKQGNRVVIVGGGTGGIVVAAQLKKKDPSVQITIIEPSPVHYYQPLWTMVGGGLFKKEDSARPMESVVPAGCQLVVDRVATFDPKTNAVVTEKNQRLEYDFLVVAAGLQVNFNAIKGLPETIGKNGVCSIYDYHQAEGVHESIKACKSGNAFFTVPATGIKCGGAPQKIMYLAEECFHEQNVRPKMTVQFMSAGPSMFPIAHYSAALDELRQKKGIEASFGHELVEVRGDKREAVFKTKDGLVTKSFEMLHVVPPMSAPDFIKKSPLANEAGFVDVDKETLRHTKFPNVFSLGDCSSLPTSKTAAAITSEAPVLVSNLLSVKNGREMKAKYNGYTSCPIITGKKSLMLAEFAGPGYGGHIMETFPMDQRVPRYIFFLLKAQFFPFVYWNFMLKGNWYGKNHFFNPHN